MEISCRFFWIILRSDFIMGPIIQHAPGDIYRNYHNISSKTVSKVENLTTVTKIVAHILFTLSSNQDTWNRFLINYRSSHVYLIFYKQHNPATKQYLKHVNWPAEAKMLP